MNIININLCKEKYYYWIDKNIVVSFEMSSQDDTKEEDVKISYGYYLYGQSTFNSKHKYLWFKDSSVSVSKDLVNQHYTFEIPIVIFNLKREDTKEKLWIQNFIHVKIKRHKITEKIYPEIVLDEYSIHLKKQIKHFHLRYKDIPSRFEYNLSKEEMSKAINAVSFFSEKSKNSDNNIKLQTEFKGLLSTSFIKIKENNLLSDYISPPFYDNLNSKISLYIFFKLIKSKIFNFVYKYSIFPPLIIWGDLLLQNRVYNLLWGLVPYNIFVVSGCSFLAIFVFSKLYEMYAKNKIHKLAYDIRLLKHEKIGENVSNKLIDWTLKINDIFSDFKINNKFLWWKYLFSVSWNCYIKSYYHDRTSKIEVITHIFSLDLFSDSNITSFDINWITLLDNNYSNLKDILPKIQKVEWYWKSSGVEIYYWLTYELDSIWLPNILKSIDITPNFD